jgi:hypothetical protein
VYVIGKESVITTSQLPEGMTTVQQIEYMEDIVNRLELETLCSCLKM